MTRLARLLRSSFYAVLGLPLAALLEWVARRSSRRAGIAIVYHGIGDPPGDPERELVPALGSSLFAAQLRHLAKHYRIVRASELRGAVVARERGERFPVAITFDDDLRSHVEVAAPLLCSLGATATFFVTGRSLDEPFRFWWERLQLVVDRGLGPRELGLASAAGEVTIHELGRAIEDLTPTARAEVSATLERLAGPDAQDAGLRGDELDELAAMGFEIAFHTREHDRLPDLDDDALARALRDGRKELETRLGEGMPTIAYPHGRADERVADAARAAGFEIGFTGDPTVATPETDPLLIGRVSPSYDSAGELALRIAQSLLSAPSSR